METTNWHLGADVYLGGSWLLRTVAAYNDFTRQGYNRGPFFGYLVEEDGDFQVYESFGRDERRPAWSHQTHVEGTFRGLGVDHEVVVGYSVRNLRAHWGAEA